MSARVHAMAGYAFTLRRPRRAQSAGGHDPQQLPFDPSALEGPFEDKSIFVGGWVRFVAGASSLPTRQRPRKAMEGRSSKEQE